MSMFSLNSSEPKAPEPEMERVVPKGLKTTSDLVGCSPDGVVGEGANIVSAGLSQYELHAQALKLAMNPSKQQLGHVATATKDLAIDVVALVPFLGSGVKGAKVAATGVKAVEATRGMTALEKVGNAARTAKELGIGKSEIAALGNSVISGNAQDAAQSLASSVAMKAIRKP